MVMGPVQAATLFQNGSFGVLSQGNWSSLRGTNSPNSAGAIIELGRYTPGAGLTLKFGAGTKFVANLEEASAQVSTGVFILAVQRPDGSRKVVFEYNNAMFGTEAVQQDQNFRMAYQTTQYAYGNVGEFVVMLLDDGGGGAWDFDNAAQLVSFPYTYRQGTATG